MADDDGKTEEPTQRRLERAHQEGDVGQSQEVKTAAVLTAGLIMMWFVAPLVTPRIMQDMTSLISQSYEIHVDGTAELEHLFFDIMLRIGILMTPPLSLLLIFGLASSVGQTGWIFTMEKIAPDFSKLNPMNGLSRMFGMQGMVELVKNILKLGILSGVAYAVLKPRIFDLLSLPQLSVGMTMVYVHGLIVRLLFAIVMVVIIMAFADWFYQKWSFTRRLRMSKQEIKDENRQTEGDPMIKARIRNLRVQRARQRMMASVPKADVVVTNPTHYACALKYDMETMNAPMLVAKGADLVAARIRQVAGEHEVPIVENAPLARALYATVEIDREIPPEHYKAVAEVISYVFKLKGKLKR